MPIPKQYVAFEVVRNNLAASATYGTIVGIHPIVAGKIVELAPRPGTDDGLRYGQVLETGELVATFTRDELIVCPVMSNG